MTTRVCMAMALSLMVATAPAVAWGPQTTTSIVSSAAHILSREGTIPLANLEEDLRGGASLPEDALYDLAPEARESVVRAIESQMYLLQAVRGDRVDPYLAYRLGVLGNLVARATAPLQGASAALREQYYEDVDNHIAQATIRPRSRQQVEPRAYFAEKRREAQVNDVALQNHYRTAGGFEGVPRDTLSENANRSMNAVADVWHAILTQRTATADIPSDRMRQYLLQAVEFYVYRGNMQEVQNTFTRMEELDLRTPQVREQVGDILLEAERPEMAMEEYQAVLEEDSNQRQVARKISEYYIEVGEEALEAERLEEAREAFQEAASADPRSEEAQNKLVQARREIQAREDRREAELALLQEGESLQEQAEGSLTAGDYASATEQLREALQTFGEVTDEFVDIAREARVAMNSVETQLAEVQERLVEDAIQLSGAGNVFDPQSVTAHDDLELNREALQRLVTQRYETEVQRLRQEMEAELGGTL
ncbi:MAG: hypothetical protein R6W89_12175 [Candidatus Hydrogenedentota bacterium]